MESANGSFKKNSNWKNDLPGTPINPCDLGPELLEEWKNYISEFERQFRKYETIKVYHRIGRPDFILAEHLDAPSLSRELKRVVQLMKDHSLCVSTLCPVEDRTLYKFITEELFDYEMEDVRIPGMKTQFCYEAFHPNHEYDLIHYTKDGLQDLLSTDDEYWMLGYQDHAFISQQGILLPPGTFIKKVTTFKQCFESFEILELSDFHIEFDLESEKASSSFFIKYSALPIDSPRPLQYQGKGHLGFAYCCEDWFINQLHLPGFSV